MERLDRNKLRTIDVTITFHYVTPRHEQVRNYRRYGNIPLFRQNVTLMYSVEQYSWLYPDYQRIQLIQGLI